MTPAEQHYINSKRLELSEANTTDILERYDNEEYHRLTWAHQTKCDDCGYHTRHADFPKNGRDDLDIAECFGCGRLATLLPFSEIVDYDESMAWGTPANICSGCDAILTPEDNHLVVKGQGRVCGKCWDSGIDEQANL